MRQRAAEFGGFEELEELEELEGSPEGSPEESPEESPELESRPILLSRTELIDRGNKEPLSVKAKRDAVAAMKTVYLNFNPNRFLHENLLDVDFPAALDAVNINENMTNVDFYGNMTKAFQLMNDKHTAFFTPEPLRSSIAVLGFGVHKFYEQGSSDRKYVVNELLFDILPNSSSFGVGAQLLAVDGVPIDEHVLALGKESYGSNQAAQIDTAVANIAFRILAAALIPARDTVDIDYLTKEGAKKSITLPWIFAVVDDPNMVETLASQVHPVAYEKLYKRQSRPRFAGLDVQKFFQNTSPKMADPSTRVIKEGRIPIEVSPDFTERFSAEVIMTKSGPIGRFVFPDFGALPSAELEAEIARILRAMPLNGLIIDVRGNRGGTSDYPKLLSESLGSAIVPQAKLTLRASKLLQRALQDPQSIFLFINEMDDISILKSAVNSSVAVGEPFTGPVMRFFNTDYGERFAPRAYFGPVVTLTDGLCYSAGDIFVSLQKDYEFSTVVGVSDNVGAGGASTSRYSDLQGLFPRIIKPVEVTFTTALLRYHRSAQKVGAIVENIGIKPDIRYFQTRKDALMEDCDLYEFLGDLLKRMKPV